MKNISKSLLAYQRLACWIQIEKKTVVYHLASRLPGLPSNAAKNREELARELYFSVDTLRDVQDRLNYYTIKVAYNI